MANSVCILGKIQHIRASVAQITDIAIENTNCDLIVETSLPSDGKRSWKYIAPYNTNADNKLTLYKLRVTGQNHKLHVLNRFNLVSVEVTLVANGDR